MLIRSTVVALAGNGWCYTKEAIISTKVYAEYKCLLNHKCFRGELNRPLLV